MSLDLVILDENGTPSMEVRIGVSDHEKIMELAKNLRLPLVNRLSDYFAETKFEVNEVTNFQQEIEVLIRHNADSELDKILHAIKDLGNAATKHEVCLIALPD